MYILNGNLYETERAWIAAIRKTSAHNVNTFFGCPSISSRQPAIIRTLKGVFYQTHPY